LAEQFDILMSPENAWRVYVTGSRQPRISSKALPVKAVSVESPIKSGVKTRPCCALIGWARSSKDSVKKHRQGNLENMIIYSLGIDTVSQLSRDPH
jgi:hypothetical protein